LKKGDEIMKIDDKITSYEVTGNMRNLSPGGTGRVEREKPAAGERVSEQAPAEGDAIVRLSEASKEAQRIKDVVTSQPEVREDKVASAREKIESGEYAVDYEGVADRLVNAFIEDLI
jgi:flagellar biosynthesis anti-sigma factor FlgM